MLLVWFKIRDVKGAGMEGSFNGIIVSSSRYSETEYKELRFFAERDTNLKNFNSSGWCVVWCAFRNFEAASNTNFNDISNFDT